MKRVSQVKKKTVVLQDPSWKLLYGAGSLSSLLYVLLIAVPLVLVFSVPQPPTSGGAAVLNYIASHKAAYVIELVCFVGLSLPVLVVFLALFAALRPLDKNLAAIGALIGIASEVVALALGSSPPSLHGGLVYLSDQYAASTAVVDRAALASAADALIAAANAVSAAGILTAAGILILSLVMRKGIFSRWVACVGIATGAVGIISEAFRPMIGFAYSLYGLLLLAWFILVGLGLLKLSREKS